MSVVPAARRLMRRRHDNMLPYYGYRVGEFVVRVLPRWLSYICGSIVARVLVTFFYEHFAALHDNLSHVRPDASDAEIQALVGRNVHNLTRSWIDVMASRPSDKAISNTSGIHIERLSASLARGQGAVVVSLHFGPWQTGAAAWNDRGGQVAVLAEELRPPRLFERIVAGRARVGIKVIPIDVEGMKEGTPAHARRLAAQALREVVKVLKGGGAVAVAFDRDMMDRGMLLPFFGEEAPIPVGAVDLAIRTGAALVPCILRRSVRGTLGIVYPEISYDSNADHDTEVRRVALELLALFERIIADDPDQWHVLEPIWPSFERRS